MKRVDGIIPMPRHANGLYKTGPRHKPRRFLMIPELRNAEQWKFNGVIDHPFFKHGPLLQWVDQRSSRTVMINRQLFYMMMRGRM